jgi:hypothetical protein
VTLSRALAAALVLLVPTACATGDSPRRERREFDRRIERANPSAVIAQELAFARAAQERGQWTAFAEFAAEDAVMFVPQPVNARTWLRGQSNPPQAVRWQPHQVWSSCDGTLALSKGAWQRPDGSTGYFTTAWQRKPFGTYRWTMDQGDTLAQPLPAPELIGATVANCTPRPTAPEMPAAGSAGQYQGVSEDGTFYWHVAVGAGNARTVTAGYWDGASWQQALVERVDAQP